MGIKQVDIITHMINTPFHSGILKDIFITVHCKYIHLNPTSIKEPHVSINKLIIIGIGIMLGVKRICRRSLGCLLYQGIKNS